ncbi:MAG: PEP-CTERM sorting domain-containing protein [Verrucomicrobiales bacterium]|jgi:hypothetical protein|nr:PEP-CTERM sorting domain-containing protein [Verrucomicrobiales bacterium]
MGKIKIVYWVLSIVLCLNLASVQAETYYQTVGDGSTQSSLNDANRWNTSADGSGSKPPTAPSNYPGDGIINHYITDKLFRTPNNTTAAYTFNADSLTINNGGTLFLKSQATTNTLTFTGTLILNSGAIINQNTATAGTNYGTIQVLNAAAIQINGAATFMQSQTLMGTATQQTEYMTINAPLNGGGTLLITNAQNNTSYWLTLAGNSSVFTGDITVNNTSPATATLARATTLTLENSIGSGLLTLGKASSLIINATTEAALGALSGRDLLIGDNVTQITLAADFTYYLQSFTALDGTVYDFNNALGKTIGGIGSGADFEDAHILSGQFIISAIPEPSTYVLFGIGFVTLLLLRKKSPRQIS